VTRDKGFFAGRVLVVGGGLVLLLLVVGLAVAVRAASQPAGISWQGIESPSRSIAWAVAPDPTNDDQVIYIGTNGGGIYKSEDGGQNWQPTNEGLQTLGGIQTGVERAWDVRDVLISRHVQPGAIYVATWGAGIYVSEDEGQTWADQFIDVESTGDRVLLNESVHVRALAESDNHLYAGTLGGVFVYQPDAENCWLPDVGSCWQPTSFKGEDKPVRALLIAPAEPQVLYAGTWGQGVFASQDGGETWEPRNKGLESEATKRVNALTLDPEEPAVLYAGTFGDGVYRSTDSGQTWQPWNQGLPQGMDVWSLLFHPGSRTLYVGTRYHFTHKRGVEDKSWEPSQLPHGALTLALGADGDLYAGTWGRGVFRSEDGDTTPWASLDLPLNRLRIRDMVFAGPESRMLYLATDSDGVYSSADGGRSWEKSDGLSGEAMDVKTIIVHPGEPTLYIGTGSGVYYSQNGDEGWEPFGGEGWPTEKLPPVVSLAFAADETAGEYALFAGTQYEGLYRFDSLHQSWQTVAEEDFTRVLIPFLLADGEVMYAGVAGKGLYRSTDLGTSWQKTGLPSVYPSAMLLMDKTLWQRFIHGGGRRFYVLTEWGLYGSEDGQQWQALQRGSFGSMAADPHHPQVVYLAVQNDSLVSLGAKGDLVPLYTGSGLIGLNDGRTWQEAGAISGAHVTRLVRDPNHATLIYASTTDQGVFRGQISLPILWREVAAVSALSSLGLLWLAATVFYVFVYLTAARPVGLSPGSALALALRPQPLFAVWEKLAPSPLTPLEKLIVANVGPRPFSLTDVWWKLDEIGVSLDRPQLVKALDALQDRRVLQRDDGQYQFTVPALSTVAERGFRASEAALLEDIQVESTLFRNVRRFFEARFDVRPDVPESLSKFLLVPRTSLYREYRRLYAWLHVQGPFDGETVDRISQEAAHQYAQGVPESPDSPVEWPVFIVVSAMPTPQAYDRLRRWRADYRIRPILFSHTSINSALRDEMAGQILDMAAHQERERADLYDIRTPVTDILDFFGREDVVNRLRTYLKGGQTVALEGLPGVGRTSLLWYLRETLLNPVVTYVDMRYGWEGTLATHSQIIASLKGDLWFKYARLPSMATGDTFEEELLAIEAAMPARRGRARIVLLIDSVSTTAEREQRQFVEELLNLAHGREGVALIVAWRDVAPRLRKQAPLLEEQVYLGPLTYQESEQMMQTIGAQMGLDFIADSLHRIYEETGGHPYLLRQLGSGLLLNNPERVTVAVVEEAAARYRQVHEQYLAQVWRWLTPEQQEALNELVAQQRETLQGRQILAALGIPAEAEEVHLALANLIAQWLVERMDRTVAYQH
jgi:photosystem II stability/assembly factor-like uncharacterized protein